MMPIEILAGLVIGGIALGAFMVWLLANSKPTLMVDAETAQEIYQLDYPEAISRDVIIAHDQHSALLNLKSSEDCLGLIVVMGSKHVTRYLINGDIQDQELSGNNLDLRLNDFTLPRLQLKFSNNKDSNKAMQWVAKLISEKNT